MNSRHSRSLFALCAVALMAVASTAFAATAAVAPSPSPVEHVAVAHVKAQTVTAPAVALATVPQRAQLAIAAQPALPRMQGYTPTAESATAPTSMTGIPAETQGTARHALAHQSTSNS